MTAVATPPVASAAAITAPAASAAAPTAPVTPGTVAGEVVTGADGAAVAATGDTKPKAKRGRAAAGMSVFPVADKETGIALAKEKGEKFSLFTVTDPPAPGAAADAPRRVRMFVSNHRNAVQHQIFTADGYTIISGTGENKGGRVADPTKKAEKAEKAFEGLDDAARLALFAKFLKGNPAIAAQLPAAAPRADTSPEFDKAPAAGATAPAAANVGNIPPAGNQPAARTATAPAAAATAPAAQASGAGKGGKGGKR